MSGCKYIFEHKYIALSESIVDQVFPSSYFISKKSHFFFDTLEENFGDSYIFSFFKRQRLNIFLTATYLFV